MVIITVVASKRSKYDFFKELFEIGIDTNPLQLIYIVRILLD